MNLQVNTVEIKEFAGNRYAFYFSVVNIKGQWCSFVSQHKCNGMADAEAKKAFTRQHFSEVEQLVMQKMRNELTLQN